MLQINKCYTI